MKKMDFRFYKWPASWVLVGWFLLNPLLTQADCTQPEMAQSGVQTELVLGKPITTEFKDQTPFQIALPLVPGQFASIVVEKKQITIQAVILDPNQKVILEYHLLVEPSQPLEIQFIAEHTGRYVVELRPKDTSETGVCQISLLELRAATEHDRHLADGFKAQNEAEFLLKQQTGETLQKAIRQFQTALHHYQAVGKSDKEEFIFNALGYANGLAGNRRKAIEYYEQSLALKRRSGNTRGEITSLLNIGASYSALGEKRKAQTYYLQVLPIARQHQFQNLEAVALNNLGRIYTDVGEPYQALELFQQALPLRKALKDRENEARTLNNLGTVYQAVGELSKAKETYAQAIAIAQECGDKRGEAIYLSNYGVLQFSFHRNFSEAEKYLQQAFSKAQATGNLEAQASSGFGLAQVYQDQKDFKRASEVYQQVLNLTRQMGAQRSQGYALFGLGGISLHSGNHQSALDYFEQALPLHRQTGDRIGEAETLSSKAQSLEQLNRPQEARENHHQALELIRAVNSRSREPQIAMRFAQFEATQGNLQAASNLLEKTLHLVESIRSKVNAVDRFTYVERQAAIYLLYIEVLMRLHQAHPNQGYDLAALEINERFRARSLLDLLTESRISIQNDTYARLLERERSLNQLLAAKYEYISRLSSQNDMQAEKATVGQELTTLIEEYEQNQAEIRQKIPRYAAISQPRILKPDDIQALLDDDTVLFQYALGSEHSYVWVVMREKIHSFSLGNSQEIKDLAHRFYKSLTDSQTLAAQARRATTSREEGADQVLANQLSERLLGPVGPYLKKKRLVIVADQGLYHIPFAALPIPGRYESTPKIQPSSSAQPAFLIEQSEVISLPSASALALLREEAQLPKSRSKLICIVADPVFSIEDPRIGKLKKDTQPPAPEPQSELTTERNLTKLSPLEDWLQQGILDGTVSIQRLLGTRKEALNILSLVSPSQATVTLDFAANRADLLNSDLKQYRYLHVATHGFVNPNRPELSGLLLSLVNQQGVQQNGFLRLEDIFNIKLSSDLVVLSACNTGLGKNVTGEGLVGLTRGFMYAGTPRLIVSLWNVSDSATAELMTQFYQGIFKENLSPATALRKAQVGMLKHKRWRLPYYWAAFVMQGEWK